MISARTHDFRHAVALAGMVVERRNAIPILSTLRCRANGRLDVAGTDLDMTMEVSVPREGGDEAAFALGDFQFISKALGANGEKAVSLAMVDGELSIDAGTLTIRAKHRMAVEDWPGGCGEVAEEVFTATLSPEHIGQLARIVPCISTEETRYYLNGIYIHHVEGWTYRAVATDGHRLGIVDLAIPDAAGPFEGAIIPRKAISVLLRSLGKSPDPVRLSGGTGARVNRETSTAPVPPDLLRVSFAGKVGSADVRLSTKTIDGTFPDYARVVPKENEITALFDIAELRRGVLAVSRPEGKVRAIKLAFGKGKVRITTHFAETSTDAGIDVAADHNAPKDFSIGFNGQYVLDMLGALRGTEVALALADSASPTVFRDPADTAFTGVLMPMRV